MTPSQEGALALFHEESCAPDPDCFVDVTLGGYPDTTNNVLCGEVADFSQFVSAIDLANAPLQPDSFTFSHVAGAWSALTEIDAEWSGAMQNPSGMPLGGYSVEFDRVSGTRPDNGIDVTQDTDPHSTTSATLGDGHWYFHLRTCDTGAFCNDALHFGPFGIDQSAPIWTAAPTTLSHPSSDPVIEVAWSSAVDPFAGVAGYAWQFDSNPAWSCDQVQDGDDTVLEASSDPLPFGDHYFHVCAVDVLGHWSDTNTLGPIAIVPPIFVDGFESGDTSAWSLTVP